MARQRRDEAKRIGARIAVLRDRAHLTQEAAAARLRVGVRTYQTWEAGDATPRWHNYERVAKLYGVKVETILGSAPLDETPEPPSPSAIEQIQQTLAELRSEIAALAERLPPGDDSSPGGTPGEEDGPPKAA